MLHYFKRLLTFILSFIKRIFRQKHKDTPILPSAFKSNSKFENVSDVLIKIEKLFTISNLQLAKTIFTGN